jgi:hypothetical protein
MNSTWTSNKTQLGVDTLKAVLVTEVNYDETCAEFLNASDKVSSFASSYF